MLKFLTRSLLVLMFSLVFSQSVFAEGPIAENRTANFSFSIEMDNDLNSSPTNVSLRDLITAKSYKGKIVIVNQDDVDAEYSINVNSAVVDENGKFKFVRVSPGDEPGESLGSWIKLDQTEGIHVKGKDASVEVPFVVQIPEGSSPGDYGARISVVLGAFTEAGASPLNVETKQTKVSVSVAKGSSLTFNVSGEVFYDLQINNAHWDKKLGEGYHVAVDLENQSNVSVRPIVFVDVKDTDGNSIYNQKFISGGSIRPFAKDKKDFYLQELKELPYGKYAVGIDAYYLTDYEFLKFGEDLENDKVGKDALNLSGNAAFAVWILPFTIIYTILVIIVFLLVIYLLWFYLRRMRRRVN